jgi:hypothetical protein
MGQHPYPAAEGRDEHSLGGQQICPFTRVMPGPGNIGEHDVGRRGGVNAAGQDAGDALGQPSGVRVILMQPLRAVGQRDQPGGCQDAGAPPKRILSLRASLMNSRSPTSTDPIGAPSPLDRQNIIASAAEA